MSKKAKIKKKEKPKVEKKEEKKDVKEEEGHYCIYCGDFVPKGTYHHH